jgi:hypothetical protein
MNVDETVWKQKLFVCLEEALGKVALKNDGWHIAVALFLLARYNVKVSAYESVSIRQRKVRPYPSLVPELIEFLRKVCVRKNKTSRH